MSEFGDNNAFHNEMQNADDEIVHVYPISLSEYNALKSTEEIAIEREKRFEMQTLKARIMYQAMNMIFDAIERLDYDDLDDLANSFERELISELNNIIMNRGY